MATPTTPGEWLELFDQALAIRGSRHTLNTGAPGYSGNLSPRTLTELGSDIEALLDSGWFENIPENISHVVFPQEVDEGDQLLLFPDGEVPPAFSDLLVAMLNVADHTAEWPDTHWLHDDWTVLYRSDLSQITPAFVAGVFQAALAVYRPFRTAGGK